MGLQDRSEIQLEYGDKLKNLDLCHLSSLEDAAHEAAHVLPRWATLKIHM